MEALAFDPRGCCGCGLDREDEAVAAAASSSSFWLITASVLSIRLGRQTEWLTKASWHPRACHPKFSPSVLSDSTCTSPTWPPNARRDHSATLDRAPALADRQSRQASIPLQCKNTSDAGQGTLRSGSFKNANDDHKEVRPTTFTGLKPPRRA